MVYRQAGVGLLSEWSTRRRRPHLKDDIQQDGRQLAHVRGLELGVGVQQPAVSCSRSPRSRGPGEAVAATLPAGQVLAYKEALRAKAVRHGRGASARSDERDPFHRLLEPVNERRIGLPHSGQRCCQGCQLGLVLCTG